jgi:hypothetical protein
MLAVSAHLLEQLPPFFYGCDGATVLQKIPSARLSCILFQRDGEKSLRELVAKS